VLLLSSFAAAATLPELLQKAKEEFRAEKYAKALQTLDELDAESARSGFEKDRVSLEPVLAFYRGAALAALGRKEEAKTQFRAFLGFQPNAGLDPAIYPKKVMAAFEEARKTAASEDSTNASLAAAYRSFAAPPVPEAETPGDDWAAGPVRFLLSSAEKEDLVRRLDAVSRSEFVEEFWRSRDPKPETPENEFRREFEKRVAFADAHFTQGETRGSLTDRGMVLILVGAPTWIGRKPLGPGDDATDSSGLARGHPSDTQVAVAAKARESDARKITTSERVAAADRASGSTITDASRGWREVWHYRRENLPAGVRYLQVDFEFLTKRGDGENVLQRDAPALDNPRARQATVSPKSQAQGARRVGIRYRSRVLTFEPCAKPSFLQPF
jgi:GWxTD domain-containing protein